MGASARRHRMGAVKREPHPVRPLIRAVGEGAAPGSSGVVDRRASEAIEGLATHPAPADSYTSKDAGANQAHPVTTKSPA